MIIGWFRGGFTPECRRLWISARFLYFQTMIGREDAVVRRYSGDLRHDIVEEYGGIVLFVVVVGEGVFTSNKSQLASSQFDSSDLFGMLGSHEVVEYSPGVWIGTYQGVEEAS